MTAPRSTRSWMAIWALPRSPMFWLALGTYSLGLAELVGGSRFGHNLLIMNVALTGSCAGVLFFAARESLRHRGAVPPAQSDRHTYWLVVPAVVAAPLAVLVNAHLFRRYGYRLNPGLFALYLALAASLLVVLIRWASGRLPRPASVRGTQLTASATVAVLALTLSLCGFAIAIAGFPLHPSRSDMLPAIQAALTGWLNGGPLYGMQTVGARLEPTPYLPLASLFFTPLVSLRLDPRVWSVGALLVMGALVLFMGRGVRQSCRPGFALFALGPVMVLRHDLPLYPVWLLLTLYAIAVIARRFWLSSLLLGLLLASYQSAFALLPFQGILLWRLEGFKSATCKLAVSLLIAAAVIAPFTLGVPEAFLYSVWGQYHRSGYWSWPLAVSHAGRPAISFAPLLSVVLPQGWVVFIQLATGAVTVGLAWRDIQDPADALVWAAVGYGALLLLFTEAWPHTYVSVYLLLMLGGLAYDDRTSSIGRHSVS